MLDDEALKQAIKEVPLEKVKSAEYIKAVEKRYLGWSISREGYTTMVDFFKDIGPGPFGLDSWINKTRVRKAATEAGFMLVKNKQTRRYAIYAKEVDPNESVFNFNPDLLDIKNDKKSEETAVA